MCMGIRPLCLVTGASAGIGAALARKYAVQGWDLFLVARRKAPMSQLASELKQAHGTKSHIFTQDLAVPDAAMRILANIAENGLHIDGFVNSAGYGHPGVYMDSDWQAHERFIQLMVTQPCALTYGVLEYMLEKNFGRIIHVASLAAQVPGSRGHTLYAASKSFLVKFSQSLSAEYADRHIYVSALCPGFTYSEFHDVNGTREMVSKMPDFMWMQADVVAEMAYWACERQRTVFVPGRVNRFVAFLGKLLPERVAEGLMRRNSKTFRRNLKS